MQQTPVHEQHNADLLALIPTSAKRLVEVGCSSGAMAREFKKRNPSCEYIGIEIEPAYAKLAERYCDRVYTMNIESAPEEIYQQELTADCWIFGDTLEHFVDPWSVLKKVRASLSPQGCVTACIPNAQHWSVQARLNCGLFRYEDSGLLDRTHLRWFTRTTIFELFQSTQFRITEGYPRVFQENIPPGLLDAIRGMAKSINADPELAAQDALALQYVVKAFPVDITSG